MEKAELIEIFDSFQGEGLLLGARQLFLRFARCNLRCRFCDTQLEADPQGFRVYAKLGEEEFSYHLNPITSEELQQLVFKLYGHYHHSLSLTGGEPLLQVEFLKEFLPTLQKAGMKVHLETNGTIPQALKEIISYIDWVSMDYKLPSSTGLGDYQELHKPFLTLARIKPLAVKMVITAGTLDGEVEAAAEVIAQAGTNIPLILQPVSPTKPGIFPPAKEKLFRLHKKLSDRLKTIRVIPKVHKLLEIK